MWYVDRINQEPAQPDTPPSQRILTLHLKLQSKLKGHCLSSLIASGFSKFFFWGMLLICQCSSVHSSTGLRRSAISEGNDGALSSEQFTPRHRALQLSSTSSSHCDEVLEKVESDTGLYSTKVDDYVTPPNHGLDPIPTKLLRGQLYSDAWVARDDISISNKHIYGYRRACSNFQTFSPHDVLTSFNFELGCW